MFWIVGGDGIAAGISNLTGSPAIKAVCEQFSEHVPWQGFRFYDMIFPLFLFMIGVALPFSVGRRMEQGDPRRALVIKVVRRTLILIALGLIYNGLLRFNGWDHIRFFGVLQRLAVGYCAAALLMMYTQRRVQIGIAVGLLLLYWGLMVAIPVPGFAHGNMTEWGNAANYLDRLLMMPHQMYEKYGDPEGPLSDIPAITTALLGVFAGYWLRSERPGERKALGLAGAGLALLAAGLIWSPLFPIIKKIWTGPYVLVAGGCSMLLLALFYWVIDVKGWSKWAFLFAVIGMNAITIYMLSAIVDFNGISTFFVGGLAKQMPMTKQLLTSAGAVTAEWLLLYMLYRQKIFLRV